MIFSESRRLAYLPNLIVMPVVIFFACLDLEQISADFENPYF